MMQSFCPGCVYDSVTLQKAWRPAASAATTLASRARTSVPKTEGVKVSGTHLSNRSFDDAGAGVGVMAPSRLLMAFNPELKGSWPKYS
jgi:hypothetical protein